jgi:hypothetical protein
MDQIEGVSLIEYATKSYEVILIKIDLMDIYIYLSWTSLKAQTQPSHAYTQPEHPKPGNKCLCRVWPA